MKKQTLSVIAFLALLLAACSDDSSDPIQNYWDSLDADNAEYEARCLDKFGLSAEDEWLTSIPEGSSLDSVVCDELSMHMRTMLSFYAICVESKYSASANRFNVRTLAERGYNSLWADVTGCKYKFSSEDNYASLVTRDREWSFDECLCKQESGVAYYRVPKEASSSSLSSSSAKSSSGKSSSSSGKSSSSSGTSKSSSSSAPARSSSSLVYNTKLEAVDIGGLLWATKNLDVEVNGSMCYKGSADNCKKYGKIYTWAMAMGLDTAYDRKHFGSIKQPYRGICPEGWYLPSHEEWTYLSKYVEQYPEYKAYFTNQIGGAYDYQGFYRSEDVETLFWSSSEYKDYDSFAWLWAYRKDLSIATDNAHKYTGAYVRCLKEGSKATWSSSVAKSSSSSVSSSSAKSSSSSVPVSSSSEISSSSEESSSSNSVYRPDVDEVLIGTQVWSTRNLNVPVEGSLCYADKPENCEKYGRIYTWAMAMGVDVKYDREELGPIELPYRGVCPEGWHLPSYEEWQSMNSYVAENPDYKAYFTNQIGGAYDYNGHYRSEGEETLFWTSTEYDVSGSGFPYEYAWLWANRKNLSVATDNAHKYTGAYVRCIKNTVQE